MAERYAIVPAHAVASGFASEVDATDAAILAVDKDRIPRAIVRVAHFVDRSKAPRAEVLSVAAAESGHD